MSVPQARIIAEKLRHLGPQIICISGGEPLVHNKLTEIAQLFSRDNYLSLITNGWLMTPEKARALFQAGVLHVSVSLDYADPEKHDALRGVDGAFERAVRALKYLQASRTRARQRVHIISIVMDDNLGEIEPLIRLSQKTRGHLFCQPVQRVPGEKG